MPTMFQEKTTDASGLEERRALVRRVIRSSSFVKSERLSSFLTYICDLTLEGKSKALNEQKIGTALFGRAPDYDCSIDGIVRTQASRLRTRLEQYFADEGADEPLQIVIPRGGYVPFFEPKLPVRPAEHGKVYVPSPFPPDAKVIEAQPKGVPESEFATPSLPRIKFRYRWLIAAVLATAVLVLVVLKHPTLFPGIGPRPNTERLWSNLFFRGKSTLLVYGDSGLVMWHGSSNRELGLSEYIAGGYRFHESGPSNLLSPSDLSNRRYTSSVDIEVVHALDRIAASRNGALDLRFARDARPNDLKQGNLILVGASEANPWVALFEPHMNFVFANDRESQVMSVVNRSPKSGEPGRWDSRFQDTEHKVFGVVAYLPNLNGDGNVLILEGTSMAGTESAWDFISDEKQFSDFLKQLGSANRQLPHFEVLLGTNNYGGSAAKAHVISWRKLE